MAITASDILFKLSTTAGAAGNANAGTVGASLGKYISTTQLSGTALHNDRTGWRDVLCQPHPLG